MVCECELCETMVAACGGDGGGGGGGGGAAAHTLRGFRIPVAEESYDAQLAIKAKHERAKAYLAECAAVDVLPSQPLGHRLRAVFQVGRDAAGRWAFGVHETRADGSQGADFTLREWPVATPRVNEAMRALLEALEARPEALGAGLHRANFVDTLGRADLMVVLYYSPGPVADAWAGVAAEALASPLEARLGDGAVQVAARWKGGVQLARPGQPGSVRETGLFAGMTLEQEEGSFSNPNGFVTRAVNEWLRGALESRGVRDARLVELCSGCGNHTLGLAPLFAEVLSVEIDSRLVAKARANLKRNGVGNVCAEVGDIRRLGPILKRHRWSGDARGPTVLLVDPPRAGLTPATASYIASLEEFDWLVFVACGEGLERNMAQLGVAFELETVCLADHFPFTHFLEKVGVLRRRRRRPLPDQEQQQQQQQQQQQ